MAAENLPLDRIRDLAGKILTRLQALEERADAEGRDLTDDEQETYDYLHAEWSRLRALDLKVSNARIRAYWTRKEEERRPQRMLFQ